MAQYADSQLLSLLAEIKPPESMPWWPLAPGWWIILAIAGIILVFAWYHKNYYKPLRRAALGELNRIKEHYLKHNNNTRLAMDIDILLRRVARVISPKSGAASLIGSDWLKFLDQQDNARHFTQGNGKILSTAPFTKTAQFDAQELIDLTAQWIKANT